MGFEPTPTLSDKGQLSLYYRVTVRGNYFKYLCLYVYGLKRKKIKRISEIFFINILGIVHRIGIVRNIFIFSRNLDKLLESFIVTLQARENENEMSFQNLSFVDSFVFCTVLLLRDKCRQFLQYFIF